MNYIDNKIRKVVVVKEGSLGKTVIHFGFGFGFGFGLGLGCCQWEWWWKMGVWCLGLKVENEVTVVVVAAEEAVV